MIPRLALISLILLTTPAVAADSETSATAARNTDTTTRTLVWPDGTRYVGGVVDGKRSGKGTIFWQDGTRFVGQFENDMRNGPGTMILPDGTVYTGFFKDDELVDTEQTLAAERAAAESTGTQAPVQSAPAPAAEIAQVDESDVITPPDEPYAEVVQDEQDTTPPETDEPAAVADIQPSVPAEPDADTPAPMATPVTVITEAVKDTLIETVDLWAAAWEDQNVVQYLAYYSDDFRVPGRQSRRTWEALRRTRLNRPSFIDLDIVYQRFDFVEPDVVDVLFRQTYRSDTYSDLTNKVLRLRREGTGWKILSERSR